MIFHNQTEAITQLESLSKLDKSISILIEGPSGSGKTYLAKQYATMRNISTVVNVSPTVTDIRDTIQSSIDISEELVVIIENLDLGVAAASYTLLKFLEEPKSYVHIIVTCSNIKNVPDTILSRCNTISIGPPIDIDVNEYAKNKDFMKYEKLSARPIWVCVKSFRDIDNIYKLSDEYITYIESLNTKKIFESNVSNITWMLQHFSDDSNIENIELVIRYIYSWIQSPSLKIACIDCLNELSYNRIAQHATLAKFAFECKYTE